MKKILGILLSMGLTFSLVACGSSASSEDVESEETKEVVESTVEEKEETVESPEVETEETEVVESVEVENAYIPHPNADGLSFQFEEYWYCEANSSEDGDTKWYIYDLTSGEIIGESTMNLIDYEGNGYDYNGICGNLAYEYCKKELIDVTTEQVIVELSENQDFKFGWNDGMLLVAEKQATFEQTTIALGVLNDKGEWITPLTTLEGEIGTEMYGGRVEQYIGEGKYLLFSGNSYNRYVYDAMSGKVVQLPDEWGHDVKGLGAEGNKVFLFSDCDNITHSFDMETGEIANFYEGELRRVDGRTDLYYNIIQGKICIVDNFGTVNEFDLSSYVFEFPRDATTSRVVALVYNEQDTKFLCLINADGSMEFEPIETSTLPEGMDTTIDDTIIMTEEKLVGWDADDGKQVFIYNTTTRETINTEVPYEVLNYYPSYDLFVVNGEHPEYGYGRYLVDTDDLETLINTFEK